MATAILLGASKSLLSWIMRKVDVKEEESTKKPTTRMNTSGFTQRQNRRQRRSTAAPSHAVPRATGLSITNAPVSEESAMQRKLVSHRPDAAAGVDQIGHSVT